jgi:hypothetical protein
MFQGAYLATAIPGAVLKDLEIEEKENRNVPLVLSYEVEIPAFAKKSGETRRVEVPFKTSLRKQSGGLPMRQTPLVMTQHADKSVDLILEIPEGMSAVLWDDFNDAEASTWGEIRREKMVQGNRVRLSYRTVLDVDRVPPEKYVAFLLFARKVDRLSNMDFVLTEGETDISAPGTKGRLLDNKSSKYD